MGQPARRLCSMLFAFSASYCSNILQAAANTTAIRRTRTNIAFGTRSEVLYVAVDLRSGLPFPVASRCRLSRRPLASSASQCGRSCFGQMAAPCQVACHFWNLALPGKWCQMSTSKSGRIAHRRCQVMKSTAALRRFPKQTRASAWPVPRNAACLWSRASVGGTPSPRSLCIPAEEVSQARIPQTCCRMGLRKGTQIYRKALTAFFLKSSSCSGCRRQ